MQALVPRPEHPHETWWTVQVAIKYLQRGQLDINVARELKSHVSFDHPHVVRFRNLFVTDTALAIVLDYCEGGDLYSYVECVPNCWLTHALS